MVLRTQMATRRKFSLLSKACGPFLCGPYFPFVLGLLYVSPEVEVGQLQTILQLSNHLTLYKNSNTVPYPLAPL